MKIVRRPLDITSNLYSRDWNVKRSEGIHLMTVVNYIGQVTGIQKVYDGEVDLEAFATPGFLWEHYVTREEKIETALSIEAMRQEFIHRPDLLFPGEMAYCWRCDDVITGGDYAHEHAKRRNHKLIFSTPDGYNWVRDRYAEFKVTWVSSRRSHPDVLNTKDGIWKWIKQDQWNCFTLDTDKAEMKVLHTCGERGRGLHQAEPYEIDIDFTPREIRETFDLIVTNCRSEGWI